MTHYSKVPAKYRRQVEMAPGRVSVSAAHVVSDRLRYEARVAHLDGRSAQARKFNRYADAISRAAQQST